MADACTQLHAITLKVPHWFEVVRGSIKAQSEYQCLALIGVLQLQPVLQLKFSASS